MTSFHKKPNSDDTHSRNLCKKLAPNRMQLYSVLVSGSRNFQTQLTNQTAQFWSRALVQVSGASFLSKFLERVSPLYGDVCHLYTVTSFN